MERRRSGGTESSIKSNDLKVPAERERAGEREGKEEGKERRWRREGERESDGCLPHIFPYSIVSGHPVGAETITCTQNHIVYGFAYPRIMTHLNAVLGDVMKLIWALLV